MRSEVLQLVEGPNGRAFVTLGEQRGETMNRRASRILSSFAVVLASMVWTSCSRQAATPSPNGVAQVGEVVISSDQMQRRLAERQRQRSFGALTATDRDEVLDELVQFEALFAQAQRAGWHTNAELLAGFKRTVVGRFKEQQLAQLRAATPTEAEISAFYEQHLAQFTTAPRLRGAVLLMETSQKATPEKRAEAAMKAAELREQAVKETSGTTHFGSLAQRHSVDQVTRYAGGDFGLLTAIEIEGRYGAALARALDALQSPGEISPVVETPLGLGFVKLIERKPEARRPLAQVRDGIAHQLTQAKQVQAEREFLAAAKSNVAIRINRALLDSIPLPVRNGEPPALPGVQTNLRKDPL